MAALAQDSTCITQDTLSLQEPKNRHYGHLDTTSRQIRLIKLRLGEHGPPHCDMEVFDLSNAPPFTALSYTWGPVSPTFNILVNGQAVSIRKGLFRFLQAHDGDEYLWIDQICIDQSNVLERNHQVGMMSSIYTQCRSVIIWLGTISTKPKAPIIFNSTQSVETLAIILQHNYFRRLWIIQEVFLAPQLQVLCHHSTLGNIWISWQAMCIVVKHSEEGLKLMNVPSHPLTLLRDMDYAVNIA